MRVLHVASEVYPLIKTGGLADVAAALPAAQIEIGIDARLLVPGYPAVLAKLADLRPVRTLADPWTRGGSVLMLGRTPDGVPCYVIDAPDMYDRPGNPYLGPDNRDWPDNHLRFALLGWVAAWLGGPEGGLRWRPDVVHGHDWQSGLAPAYLELGLESRTGPRPATVLTIHNIAYQGLFPAGLLGELRLPAASFAVDGLEYYGQIGFLKAGLYYADRISTVSPTYAEEIQSPDGGWGLHGLLASRAGDLWGILNGVDYGVWSPAVDPALVRRYDVDSLEDKAANKTALREEFGLEQRSDAPLFGVVSRLTPMKGFDLLLSAIPALVAEGAQFAVLGSGEGWLEDGFRDLAERHRGQVGVHVGYDEPLSHRVQAGSDVIMLPSRSEPCGLIQLYGLRYGTLPLVRRVGGLADTVADAQDWAIDRGEATGFVFDHATVEDLAWACRRAVALYRDPGRWRAVQRAAMRKDFSWAASARRYLEMYRTVYPDE
ncbi:glycogen synthase GlgA [Skermanella rosea]|uniref:glycogen synthase GlgA n=1 Tax=Skermanella rosea TaxID=1817965 RepID=UPI0019332BF7|nr:glycogen synthase GlgA [Skermanella rosea]UEM03496.1 glycogen synthase GlgA [Skermanella rosea]